MKSMPSLFLPVGSCAIIPSCWLLCHAALLGTRLCNHQEAATVYAHVSMARKHITPNCRHAAGGQVSPQSTVCCRNTQFSPTQDGLDASCPCPASGPSSRCLPCNQKFQRGHHPLQGTSWTSALEGLARLTHTRQPPFYTLLCRKGVRVAAPLLLLIPGPRLRELGKHQQAMLGAVRTLWFSNHITHPVRDQKHGRHTLAEGHSPLRVTTAAPLTHHTLPHRLFRRCLQTRAYICGHTHACTHTRHIHTYTRAHTHTLEESPLLLNYSQSQCMTGLLVGGLLVGSGF